jgi:hypothetical protein
METMKIIPMLIHRANRQEVQVVIEIVGEDPLAKRGCLREYPHWTTLGETPLSRGICHQSFHLQSPTPPLIAPFHWCIVPEMKSPTLLLFFPSLTHAPLLPSYLLFSYHFPPLTELTSPDSNLLFLFLSFSSSFCFLQQTRHNHFVLIGVVIVRSRIHSSEFFSFSVRSFPYFRLSLASSFRPLRRSPLPRCITVSPFLRLLSA